MIVHGSTAIVGQMMIGLFFLVAGVNQFFNLDQMKAYASAKRVPAVNVVIPIVALILAIAGCLILFDPFVEMDILTYGVLIGVVSTFIITLLMHDFWRMAEQEDHLMMVEGANGGKAKMLPPQDNEIYHFLKNLALIGGVLLLLP